MEEMECIEREEGFKSPTPVWWEVVVFRILNAIMVIFFLAATVKLQSDDNACLWIPAFLVPAFLSTVVAMKPQLSGRRSIASHPSCFVYRMFVVEGLGDHPHLPLNHAGTGLVYPAGQDHPC